MMTVRGSGSFTADLIDRVMKGARGVNDLDTLFARYNQEDQTSEQITAAPDLTPTDTQPALQIIERRSAVAKLQRRTEETTRWVATQLSLF
ncbi:MAG: hypothetical protein GY832_40170 [Chloroflexi bacterium]|nr:hypothetical protein [Chloroflexota bacterium]